jgi:two-component system cell cycle sensor histidine kinase PleC
MEDDPAGQSGPFARAVHDRTAALAAGAGAAWAAAGGALAVAGAGAWSALPAVAGAGLLVWAAFRLNAAAVAARAEAARDRARLDERSRHAELLRHTLESIDRGVALIGADRRILVVNRRFAEMIGLPPGAPAEGTPVEALVRQLARRGDYGPGDVEEIVAARMEALGRPGAWRTDREGPDGRMMEVTHRPLPDGGLVATYADVTDVRSAERSLRAAMERAEQASRAKTMFFANVSHELRTPLNAIIGFAELIAGDEASDRAADREYARDIRDSGRHLLAVINDILDYARLEAGRLELSDGRVDVAETAEAARRVVAGRAEERGVRIAVETPPDLPRVVADPVKLRQILINLIANAVKFTPRGGEVSVRAAVGGGPGGGLSIEVRDTGIGMTPDEVRIALEPFGQAAATGDGRRDGSGLGLPLARALAELHGGALTVESAPGAGTTVRVTLPAERVEPTADVARAG